MTRQWLKEAWQRWLDPRSLFFAFSSNLLAENSKLSVGSGLQGPAFRRYQRELNSSLNGLNSLGSLYLIILGQ